MFWYDNILEEDGGKMLRLEKSLLVKVGNAADTYAFANKWQSLKSFWLAAIEI